MSGPRVRFGVEAATFDGKLPGPFPRVMGPNAGKYVQEVIDSGFTANFVRRVEAWLCERFGVAEAIGTPGCSAALGILAAALGFEPGDEIVVSPISDYGTVMGFVKEQLIPVFADTEPGSPNVSADTVRPHLTDRTRAIVVVHKTGLMCDMPPLVELARERGLVLIEDACQAFGSRRGGKDAGTWGDVGVFSFDVEKTIGADIGGAIITDDADLAERCRFIGQSRGGYQVPGFGRKHSEPGLAYRMPACTAATTLAQLEIADGIVAQRDRIIRRITAGLAEIDGITPLAIPADQDVYSCWMLGLRTAPERDESPAALGERLAAAGVTGIGAAPYYLLPAALEFLPRQVAEGAWPYQVPPAGRRPDYRPEATPEAAAFVATFLRTSAFCEKWTEAHADWLVATVERVLAER